MKDDNPWVLLTFAEQFQSVLLLTEVERICSKKQTDSPKVWICHTTEELGNKVAIEKGDGGNFHRFVILFDYDEPLRLNKHRRMRYIETNGSHDGMPEWAHSTPWAICIGHEVSPRRLTSWAEQIVANFSERADKRVAHGQCPWGERPQKRAVRHRPINERAHRNCVLWMSFPSREGLKTERLA